MDIVYGGDLGRAEEGERTKEDNAETQRTLRGRREEEVQQQAAKHFTEYAICVNIYALCVSQRKAKAGSRDATEERFGVKWNLNLRA
jgi:hypothetical protein